jgi:hypothetical protein
VPTTVPATTIPVVEAVKPVLTGLIDRWQLPSPDRREVVNGFVVNLTWAELQARPGAAITPSNPLDDAIDLVRRLNASQPGLGLGLKVRIQAGIGAPAWAKRLGGKPVRIVDPDEGVVGRVGRFWEPSFGSAYADLQRLLAELYDGVPEVREVTISRCTTVYAEPFQRDIRDDDSVDGLLDAGFSLEADEQCLREQIDAHDVWRWTRSSLALNPYQVIRADGSTDVDVEMTIGMMEYCRDRLQERCVLANHSIRWPPFTGRMAVMYDAMTQLGPPFSFQTAAPARLGDLVQTLRWAAVRGACAVELPRGYKDMASPAELTLHDALLAANDGCA